MYLAKKKHGGAYLAMAPDALTKNVARLKIWSGKVKQEGVGSR